MSEALIYQALSKVIDPELRIALTELDMVGKVSFQDGTADVEENTKAIVERLL